MKKPEGSGRKPGVKNKKHVLKLSDYIIDNDINIAKYIWDTINTIDDPVQKTKALFEYYRYIEAPFKEKTDELAEQEAITITYTKVE